MEKLTIYKSKEIILEHKIIYSVIFLSILFILFCIVFGVKITKEKNLLDTSNWPSESMQNGIKYTQYFKSNVDDLSGIGIKFSTYRNENKNGSLVINLYDQNDNLIKYSKTNVEDVKDNQVMYIEFDKIKKSKNQNFKIEIYFEEYNENIVLVSWNTKADEDNFLAYDDVKTDSSIDLVLTGKVRDNTVLIYPLLVLLICLIWLVII